LTDLYPKETRSYVMSRIRKRDTKPELLLRRALHALGVRGWRLRAKLPGTPDLVITRARLAVFVDGCFWHACPRCAIPSPKSNRRYWGPKISRNVMRDARVTLELRALGWRTLRVWEHDVMRDPERCARKVVKRLTS
jgi:DNA mismatch endonuclease (patch repair protein)